MRSHRNLIIIGLVFCLVTWVLVLGVFSPEFTTRWLAHEDGPIEGFGALSIFAAAIVFGVAFIRSNVGNNFLGLHTRRNYILLAVSLILFFGAGEEVSWGQRTFQIKTPEGMREMNTQQEFNLHNLKGANFPKAYDFFWAGFTVLIPLVYMVSPRIRKWLNTLRMPIVPLEFGFLMLISYMILKLCYRIGLDDDAIYGGALTEIHETQTEFFFLLIAIACYRVRNVLPSPEETIAVQAG